MLESDNLAQGPKRRKGTDMTNRKKRPIKPSRPPPRRGQMPEVPTVTDHAPAQAEPPTDETNDAADGETIRRMVEASYT